MGSIYSSTRAAADIHPAAAMQFSSHAMRRSCAQLADLVSHHVRSLAFQDGEALDVVLHELRQSGLLNVSFSHCALERRLEALHGCVCSVKPLAAFCFSLALASSFCAIIS